MNLKSSVLVIDQDYSSDNPFGADVSHVLETSKKYSAIVINLKSFTTDKVVFFIRNELAKNPNTQFVIKAKNLAPQLLKDLTNQISIFKILSSDNETLFERTLQEAIAEHDLKLQNQQLFDLFKDQNDKLKQLSLDLEDRVLKRQRFLESSKEKLLQVNQYFKSLLSALFAVQKSNSLPEIENNLHKALAITLDISWVRITYQALNPINQTTSLNADQFSLFSNDLRLDNRALGHITFARAKHKPFIKEDLEFLTQLSEAIALAIDRLNQLEKSEFLRQQWKSTFDAISEPVALIDSNYIVLDYNASYETVTRLTKKEKGKKCYELMFGRNEPCIGCELGKSFSLNSVKVKQGSEKSFDVHSHLESNDIYVNFYRDVTDQIRVERQILESSKMAELGTIGSSIAHELNNPLAGLLTFLQLIKSDMKGNEFYFNDIIEMEKAALRCKDIIQNLLSFTRKSKDSAKEKLTANQIVENAIKIINLKANSLGIKIEPMYSSDHLVLEGHSNLLAQALVNIFQNSIESLSEKMKSNKNFNPKIEVAIYPVNKHIIMEITDNGLGLSEDAQLKAFTPFFTTKSAEKHRGLGLPVAFQIIQDHGGSIELSNTSDLKTRARITFPSSF